ncbi:MAG: SPOR domain-containing protein [Pseudomonadota bacterium]
MADMDYFGADYGAEEPSRLAEAVRNFGIVNWAGALTSLGLVGGMAVWTASMTFRDVSEVPVVRAIEGPMRIAPENPGGQVAPFQGMALSDITSGGPAAPAPDQIVLAPPPVELEAAPLGERLAAAEEQIEVPAEIAAPPLTATPVVAPTPRPDVDMAALSDVAILAAKPDLPEAETASVEPLTVSAPETPLLPEGTVRVTAASVTAVPRTERPRLRPAVRAAASAVPAAVPTDAPLPVAGVQVASIEPVAPTVRDVDPASVAPGTRVVQLGAFDSEEVARQEWDRLYGRFGDFMEGKSRMIQRARSGGRDFWRLRVVGFADASDARRFCSTLLAREAACIPVTMR